MEGKQWVGLRQQACWARGPMGNGIAHVMARAGLRVTLCEVEQRFLDRGIETIRKNLDREVAKEKLTAEEAAAALGRIHGTLNRQELAECEFRDRGGDGEV